MKRIEVAAIWDWDMRMVDIAPRLNRISVYLPFTQHTFPAITYLCIPTYRPHFLKNKCDDLLFAGLFPLGLRMPMSACSV